MTIPIINTAATVMCPHGGTVSLSTSQSSVKADGSPVCLETDIHTVSGCPFQVPIPAGTKPQPCVTVRWTAAATQTTVNGIGVLLQSSVGLCYSAEQIPQGPATVSYTQQQAKGL
ncbi:hypothetical protein [Roseitranquillus sediminis]|uniref:hypothetical protein n=1 Tax=Roseitranquillus sediminis TaxID=2809051 RepID=UPI001D0C6AC6|nr:hypothetical protein [Roseitranquillus sediminis]MBM9594978.1 hypothetical protein [Roseitranquillus sediminis]